MMFPIDSFVSIPMRSDLYLEAANRYPGKVATLVADVLQDFLERTSDDFDAALFAKRGIHWESVFLPNGTEIRTQHYGVTQTAGISGDEIVWNGEVYRSMSRLASAMRGNTSNNAWKVLEIKLPSGSAWQLADRLRS